MEVKRYTDLDTPVRPPRWRNALARVRALTLGRRAAKPAGGQATAFAAPRSGAEPFGPDEDTLRGVDFLAHVDAHLRFMYVSDASLQFIGYHHDYLRTVSLVELLPSGEAPRLAALIERARASGGVERDTLHLVKSLTYPTAVELRVAASTFSKRSSMLPHAHCQPRAPVPARA
jgi:hypothetical protein